MKQPEEERSSQDVRADAEDMSAQNDEPRNRPDGLPDPQAASPVSRLSRRGWLVISAAIAVLILIVYELWPSSKAASPAEEEVDVVVSVRVAKAERGTISSDVSAIGTIAPRERAAVSSKINAQIKSMPLLKNKPVRAGEVIATLESRDLQAQRAEAAAALEEAQANARLVSGGTIPETSAQDEKTLRDARANVANARATYERRLALYERGGISKKDVEASQLTLVTAENDLRAAETAARLHQVATNPNNRAIALSRVNQARDRLAALDTQLSYAVIRAPFSGVITEQFQYEGEYASAGGKLITIADVSELIVRLLSPTLSLAILELATPATVLPEELPDTKLIGSISLVSRASDPQNRTVEVWINLKNEGGRLRADSSARVVVATKTASDAIVVPAAAVTLDATNADEGTVMVVDEESVAHERKVTVGIRTSEKMQIISGLEEGETVVVEGNYALPDGTKVEVSEEGKSETDNEEGTSEGAGAGSGSTPNTKAPSQDGTAPNSSTQTTKGGGSKETSGTTAAPGTKSESGAKAGSGPATGGKP